LPSFPTRRSSDLVDDGLAHIVELEWLDDCGNQLHGFGSFPVKSSVVAALQSFAACAVPVGLARSPAADGRAKHDPCQSCSTAWHKALRFFWTRAVPHVGAGGSSIWPFMERLEEPANGCKIHRRSGPQAGGERARQRARDTG